MFKKFICLTFIIFISSLSSIPISIGILFPKHTYAQDTNEEITTVAKENCQKIAEQLGDPVPAITVESNFDIPYNVCLFRRISSSEDEGKYYASKTIADVKMVVHEIEFKQYSTTEDATNDLNKEEKSTSKYAAENDETATNLSNDFVKKFPDGYAYVSKFSDEKLFGIGFTKSEGLTTLVKGSCRVKVEVSNPEYGLGSEYHFYDDNNEPVNRHPGFNHDREAEVLELERQKAEEILDSLDCGTSPKTSPTTDTQPGYGACAWECADQGETKYQCSFDGPLDSCVTDKMLYQSSCQDACWGSWVPPQEPKLRERGAQLKKIEQNGKTALLVVGHDSSISDSVMDEMKDKLADWDPNYNQLNVPTQTSKVPLGLGVLSLDGDVDIKRPGNNTWEPLRKGTAIPEGSQVFTGIDGNVWIYGTFGVANIEHGSYITINKNSANGGNDPNIRFDIQFGKVEIRYEKANYQGIIQTRTPSAIATVKGTKFYISYDQKQRYSTIGVYEGQVEVQSLITGEKIELSAGGDGKQNLVFLPLPRPRGKNKGPVITTAIIVLGVMATAFILYKKRKG